MPDSRAGYANGVSNGRPQPQRPAQSAQPAQAFNRPFGIQEALPYTPFTSIAPIYSDIVPTPNLVSGSPATELTDGVATADFEALNSELATGQPPSKRLEQTLSSFQTLLDPRRIPEYKFKVGPKIGTGTASAHSMGNNLSPLSKLVVDQSTITFRYPTPETPGPIGPIINGHSASPHMPKNKSPAVRKAEKPKQSPKQSAIAELNRHAHAQNAQNAAARFEIVLSTKKPVDAVIHGQTSDYVAAAPLPPVTPARPQVIQNYEPIKDSIVVSPQGHQPAPQVVAAPTSEPTRAPSLSGSARAPSQSLGTPSKGSIAVELPRAKSFNKKEYLVVADATDEPDSLSSRKRKREEYDSNREMLGQSLGHRERSDAAFSDLKRCIHDAFGAERHLLDYRSNNEFVYFTLDREPTLSAVAQQKIHSLVAKSIDLNCFAQAPIDDLLHIVRLSAGALRHAESLDLKLDEAWGPSEVELWLQLLPDVDAGLKAARTTLRMMCGGREDKQLYSEGTIELALNLFKHVLDGIIVPLAELRSTRESFKLLTHQRDRIGQVLTACQRLFTLMTTLISTIDTSETVVTTLEFAASTLVFIETAHSEKESVIEIHRFDGLRLAAMDMLSQVFLLNPAQRPGIFDDILTSLEKLPVGKQRARQFKLVDGTSIQPVSALIMRLIQASAGRIDDKKRHTGVMALPGLEANDEDEPNAGHGRSNVALSGSVVKSEQEGAENHAAAVDDLQSAVGPLVEGARKNATYVANFIIKRALQSTKTGDTPYRNLLDLFVEDFTACLNNPDWPAAELLLQMFMAFMVNNVNDAKSSAPSKNMALEVLGVICAAISRLRSYVRKTANSLDASEGGDLGIFLADLGLAALTKKNRADLMMSWSGPYRATLEHLEERHSDDPHLGSAISFLISDWADNICKAYNACDDDDEERDVKYGQLAFRLRMMVHDRRWLVNEYSFKSVSPKLAGLSYAVILLRSPLSESFPRMLNLLLQAMASDQATVRSKSLRSINQLLETDPSIMDGNSLVIERIRECLVDSSTQVRDSALGLIGKCISLRPALEQEMTPIIIERFIDTGVGVRKRAMKLAKDIYLRNTNKVVRSDIANALLYRFQDREESVRDLARQMIEEIWFAPFAGGENSAASKTSLADHVALMVQTVKRGNANLPEVLDKVFQSMLRGSAKSTSALSQVSAKFVDCLFDIVNTSDSDDASNTRSDALQLLVVFAKAEPNLFNFEQISVLKLYIESMSNIDNVADTRAVIVIYRRVLPQLSKAHVQFLQYVRDQLGTSLSKPQTLLLDDVFACLWIISVLLENKDRLTRLVVSVLKNIGKVRALKPEQMSERHIKQFMALSRIAGAAGKNCDLDSQIQDFKAEFPNFKGDSVSKLMVDLIIGFAAPRYPLDVRAAALESIGLICQSWPKNYTAANVYTAFRQVFDEQNPQLEVRILRGLKEFFLIEEQRSELAKVDEATGKPVDTPKKRELTVMGGTTHDDAASGTTQRFLKDITRIALADQDTLAFHAIEVLASINRQGIVHPKETGVTFMTLETSPVSRFSEIAYLGHKMLHEKHESAVEREYGRALQEAFAYQRDVVKDLRGATTDPFAAKLHLWMEVLKVSNSQKRIKFLEKLCSLVDFDLAKLNVAEEMPSHLQFSQFLIENIAFLEYSTVGEVQAVVAAAERMFSTTGAPVAHAIESEVFQMRMDIITSAQPTEDGQAAPFAPTVDIMRLRQLTAASMVLLALWEARAYLRKLYGMGTTRRDPKPKSQAKDLNKAPVKVQGVTGDKSWEDIANIMTSLSSRERMTETCRSFVELMNMDKELKIADEEDEMNGDDPTTPSNEGDDEDGASINTPARGRKRKANGTQATPSGRKKRARSNSQPRKRGRPKKQAAVVGDIDADGEPDDGEWF